MQYIKFHQQWNLVLSILAIANFLRSSQVGVVQYPIRFGDDWLIIRVEQIIPARLDKFMYQRLLKEQFDVWLQGELNKLTPSAKIWMGIQNVETRRKYVSTTICNLDTILQYN